MTSIAFNKIHELPKKREKSIHDAWGVINRFLFFM